MVREETGHTTARNLSRERKNYFFLEIIINYICKETECLDEMWLSIIVKMEK
jgi:hypothetical protein